MSFPTEETPQQRLFSLCQLFIEHVLFSFQDAVRPQLSSLQLRTLMCLHEYGPQTMSELAERLLIPRQQMTQIVDRLTEMDLISRQRDEIDRRVVRIVWSEAGKAQFTQWAAHFWDDFYARLHTLPQQDVDAFMQSADIIRRLLPLIPADSNCERRSTGA